MTSSSGQIARVEKATDRRTERLVVIVVVAVVIVIVKTSFAYVIAHCVAFPKQHRCRIMQMYNYLIALPDDSQAQYQAPTQRSMGME